MQKFSIALLKIFKCNIEIEADSGYEAGMIALSKLLNEMDHSNEFLNEILEIKEII
jgi:hypothetical protein